MLDGVLYRRSFQATDAPDHVRRCHSCLRQASIFHQPLHKMVSMLCPIPFYQWGVNIVGDLQRTAGSKRYDIVAVDYFTKWVEPKPLPKYRSHDKLRVLSTTNDQVEVMNRVIIKGVKKRLQQDRGDWDQELPTVLWSFRKTRNMITGETPFILVYRSDALLPVEIHVNTARLKYHDELDNE
ncbi:hypothetical protein LIER_36672 [Lithospermum erythrorhizon]|uniref:Uncharacterized protein n=1 Tax=Lithospermum erythrorhizon TaxID=34254 RepID=A0AAV3PAC1_LITER